MASEISAQEAAELVGVTNQTVRNWCSQGLVKYRRVGRQKVYHVDREDLVRYAMELGYIQAQE